MNQLVSSVDNSTNDVTTYTYDIYGNLVNDGEYIYTYDSYFNRLYSVRNIETNGSVYYEYYVDGLRKSKGNTYFIWLDGNMVYEFTGSDSNTYTYGHRLLYSDDYKYVLNAHGDVVSRLDSIGNELKRYKYDAFGNELNPSASDTNPFRYCAEYFDVESGQIYLRNRYYQPVTGRFSQLDPIRDGLNWYAYCTNNPVYYHDTFGLTYVPIFLWASKYNATVTRSYGKFGTYIVTLDGKTVSYSTPKVIGAIIDDRVLFNDFGSYGVGSAKPYSEIPSEVFINCYGYALQLFGINGFVNPGELSGNTLNVFEQYSVETVANYVISDLATLNRSGRIINGSNDKILPNERRIAVRVGTTPTANGIYDYHFMVQNSDGTWSEKHGDATSLTYEKGKTPDNLIWYTDNPNNNYYDSEIIYIAITD